MAEASGRVQKARTSTDGSIIKLRAAFARPKKKPVTTRTSSVVSQDTTLSHRPRHRDRSVRFTYHSGISEIINISKNLDKVTVLVDHLHMRATPVSSLSPPPPLRPSSTVNKSVTVDSSPFKSLKPTVKRKADVLNSTLSSITSSDIGQLYRKRGDGDDTPIPIIKETKPNTVRKTRDYVRHAFPLFRS